MLDTKHVNISPFCLNRRRKLTREARGQSVSSLSLSLSLSPLSPFSQFFTFIHHYLSLTFLFPSTYPFLPSRTLPLPHASQSEGFILSWPHCLPGTWQVNTQFWLRKQSCYQLSRRRCSVRRPTQESGYGVFQSPGGIRERKLRRGQPQEIIGNQKEMCVL